MGNSTLEFFGANGMDEIAGFAAFFISVVALILSLFNSKRESRQEVSQAYLQLETQSSNIFQFEAANEKAMRPYRQLDRPRKKSDAPMDGPGAKVTAQLYYQSLNLFEVAAKFRRRNIVDADVFASWVAWFYELLNDWYFRIIWEGDAQNEGIRENYTTEVRNIFDAGLLVFKSPYILPEDRKKAFYAVIAEAMGGCKEISGWLEACDDRRGPENWTQQYIDRIKGE